MDLTQGIALVGLAAILAANAGIYFRLGKLCQAYTDLRERVDHLEGKKHGLASQAA